MLEQKLQLPHTELRNRLVMGSMHTGLEEGWHNRKRLRAFYEALKKYMGNGIVNWKDLPKFPGKKFFGRMDVPFLIKRQNLLGEFMNSFLSLNAVAR